MSAPLTIGHVLYAEDDPNDVFFMTRAFEQLGLREALQVVSTGRQAVDHLAAALGAADGDASGDAHGAPPMPELVLLDVKMPLLSGREVLAWIRERRALDDVAVVLFTSSTQPSDLAYASEHGADGLFVKPADARQLMGVVESILESMAHRTRGARLAFAENRLARRG